MKAQDAAFLVIFVVLAVRKHPQELALAGIFSLILAAALYAGWIFFTAERLTWYAAAFLLTSVTISLMHPRKVK